MRKQQDLTSQGTTPSHVDELGSAHAGICITFLLQERIGK